MSRRGIPPTLPPSIPGYRPGHGPTTHRARIPQEDRRAIEAGVQLAASFRRNLGLDEHVAATLLWFLALLRGTDVLKGRPMPQKVREASGTERLALMNMLRVTEKELPGCALCEAVTGLNGIGEGWTFADFRALPTLLAPTRLCVLACPDCTTKWDAALARLDETDVREAMAQAEREMTQP